jgi:hypothetical protein
MLVTGALVSYRPREGEPAYPAIVMQSWPDDSVELHVIHHDAGSHIRSASPAEFDVVFDPTQRDTDAETIQQLTNRISDLEDYIGEIRPLLNQYFRHFDITPIPVPTPAPTPAPIPVDASMLDEDDLLPPLIVHGSQEDPDEDEISSDVDSTPTETDLSATHKQQQAANPWKKKGR